MAMSDQDIRELLPFYVAGTLDAEQRLLVEEALRTSDVLRKEAAFWNDAREILAVHARHAEEGHLTPTVLVDRARGALSGTALLAADRHLQSCPDCADLLRRIVESPGVRDAAPASPPAGIRRWLPSSRLVYGLPLAAGLAALLVFVLIDSRREPSPPTTDAPPPQAAREGTPAVERTLTLVLTHRATVRSADPVRIPAFALGGKDQRVIVVFAIPKRAAAGIRFDVTAENESARRTPIEQGIEPFGFGTSYDSLRVIVPRVSFPPPGKTVTFVVTEILTPELSDLTPEEYRFEVIVQEGNK